MIRRKDRVLILGDDTRSFLATVRSLGRKDIVVHVAPYNMSAPALKSRYIEKIHRLPYYLDGGQAWLSAIKSLMAEEGFTLVIPCEERSLLPLYIHRAELEPYAKLAIPDAIALDYFFDKVRTRELALALNIPVANAKLITKDIGAADFAAGLNFPLFAKFRRSYSLPDLYVRKGVSRLDSDADCARWIKRQHIEGEETYLEEIFPGIGVGLSILSHQGKILLAFEHHRANEVGGSSYYRKSAAIEPTRLEAVRKMAQAVCYTGVAMFEFKANPVSHEWILLEINARPWGSLPLPLALGIDFPYGLFQLLARGIELQQPAYKYGIYGRNLVPDIWHARTAISHCQGALEKIVYLWKWLWGFHRVLTGREHSDLWVRDDPLPARIEVRQFLHDRFTSRLRPKVARQSIYAGAHNRLRLALGSAATANLLFICQGNICRSPYAAVKARQLLGSRSIQISVTSAGMLPRNSRQSPQVAIDAASGQGVNLGTHRSQVLTDWIVAQATVIIVFDEINRRSFLERYPEFEARLFNLSDFDPDAEAMAEIKDPHGQSMDIFRTTYQQIDHGLIGLMASVQDQVIA